MSLEPTLRSDGLGAAQQRLVLLSLCGEEGISLYLVSEELAPRGGLDWRSDWHGRTKPPVNAPSK